MAKVAGNDITTLEVLRSAKQMVRQQFPKGGAQASMLLPFFTSQAAQQLINEKVVLAEAERLGLRATDEDVRDELQHGQYAEVFFPGGTFIGEVAYEERLQQADLTIPVFEQSVKNEILFDKLRALVAGSAAVTEAEVRQQFEKQNTKVKFDYAVLKKDDILKEIHPTDAELKAFYERNKASYSNSIPEKRKISYVLIDTAKIQAETQVSQRDLQAYYDQHRDEYRVPDQVNVRHILIKTPLPGPDGKVDPKGVDEARKKAEDVLKQLKAGANFADLAKKYSEDVSSAKDGGSLGWIQRGRFPAEVDKAVFALPKGGTSEVIDTGSGFDIVRVEDKQDAHAKTLDEVKSEIEPIIKSAKSGASRRGARRTHCSPSPATLASTKRLRPKACKLLQPTSSAALIRCPELGAAPRFMDAVFNEAEKSPPDEAQLPQGFAVFRVTGDQTARYADFRGDPQPRGDTSLETSALRLCCPRKPRSSPIGPRLSTI